MSRFSVLLVFAIAMALLAGFGCYTMVRHPGPSVATFDEAGGQSCLDCHAGADYDHWSDPYYSAFYNDAPTTWGAYYAHPWWYNESWYRRPDNAPKDAQVTRGQPVWGRGPQLPALAPVAGSTTPQSPTSGNASISKPDTSKSNPQNDPKERDNTQTPPRPVWRR